MMNFDLAQLALIFLPGILWASIDARYGPETSTRPTTFAIKTFVFGMSTYLVLFLLYAVFEFDFEIPRLNNGPDGDGLFDFADKILFSIPISITLAVIWLWIANHRLVGRLLNLIRATNNLGPGDVWLYTMSSNDIGKSVIVRDKVREMTYSGLIRAYSSGDGFRELLLTNATVFDEFGTVISEPGGVYLSGPNDAILLEFTNEAGRNQ